VDYADWMHELTNLRTAQLEPKLRELQEQMLDAHIQKEIANSLSESLRKGSSMQGRVAFKSEKVTGSQKANSKLGTSGNRKNCRSWWRGCAPTAFADHAF